MSSILIVGGLTIDRFADGSRAPGGSVIHAGSAGAADGAEVGILTVAGPEAEARAGLERLASLGPTAVTQAPRTITYGHHEADGRRVLVLEAAGGQVEPLSSPIHDPGVVLFAPIADEVPASAVGTLRDRVRASVSAFLIQGWLRRLVVGEPVVPVPLDRVATDLWATFGRGDLVVVSTEDLADGQDDPFAQAAALRAVLGQGPILVLTLGTRGYLLDDPAADRIVAAMPRRVVEGAPTVGAGDTFGAVMALRLAAGATPTDAADAGTEAVIRLLDSRRP